MKVEVHYDEVKDYVTRVNLYPQKCYTALKASAKTSAKSLENKARKNAKWIDRTGQARKSVTGTGEQDGDKFIITLEGYATDNGKEYFQYLELYHQKKNAILYPTIEKEYDNVMQRYANVLSKVKL